VKHFLKWAGGKGRLLPDLNALRPEGFSAYHEPFVGSGAFFFSLRGAGLLSSATLSDSNQELINTYHMVRSEVEELISRLAFHQANHSKEHYYAIRELDLAVLPPVARAARFIYLNKTCFNGLYRVNRQGKFNVPIGRYTNPTICNEPVLRAASAALQGVELRCEDFSSVQNMARAGDLVYFDPPYVPVSLTSNYTSYTVGEFLEPQQRQLAEVFAQLAERGVQVMLSNSDTSLVRELYREFNLHEVRTTRSINSKAELRGKISELVVTSY
jgi:DNA adenine methylase